MDSTRRIFDQFNNLEGVTRDAGRLCHALDQWKHGADGRTVSDTVLVEMAATLGDHDDRPGISQLAASLAQWAQRRGLELQPPTPPTPTRSSMGIEIDFWEDVSSDPQTSDSAVAHWAEEATDFAGTRAAGCSR